MATTDALHRGYREVNSTEDETVRGLPPPSSAPMAMEVLSGMAAGAALGAIAGPPGMIAGAVLGSAVGAAAAIALGAQSVEDQQRDDDLDRDIGVIDGDLGAAAANQPPTTRGAFSAASMGVGSGAGAELSEGPIPSAGDQ